MCRTDARSPRLQTSNAARLLRDVAVYFKARGRFGSLKPSTHEATPHELPTCLFVMHHAQRGHSRGRSHPSSKLVKFSKAVFDNGYGRNKEQFRNRQTSECGGQFDMHCSHARHTCIFYPSKQKHMFRHGEIQGCLCGTTRNKPKVDNSRWLVLLTKGCTNANKFVSPLRSTSFTHSAIPT